ncbi:MAG: metallophosphoesterase [archaeon]
MKILAFVDSHNIEKNNKAIIKKSKEADILVCAGDLTWFGKDLDRMLKTFAKIEKIILMIHGNHEDPEKLEKLCKKYKNIRFLHKKSFRMGNRVFFGWGGGGFARQDKRFEQGIALFKKTLKKGDKLILITHGPPYKTKLDELHGDYVGNNSYNKAIKTLKPLLYICGHIEENAKAKQVIGKTLIINPGGDGEILKV